MRRSLGTPPRSRERRWTVAAGKRCWTAAVGRRRWTAAEAGAQAKLAELARLAELAERVELALLGEQTEHHTPHRTAHRTVLDWSEGTVMGLGYWVWKNILVLSRRLTDRPAVRSAAIIFSSEPPHNQAPLWPVRR